MKFLFLMKQKSVTIKYKFNAFGHKFKNMIQNIIKKVLCKWLKKKLYDSNYPLSTNVARFKWVYDSPLRQWRDRVWVVTHTHYRNMDICNYYIEYLTDSSFQ